jgi:hypothetical protein
VVFQHQSGRELFREHCPSSSCHIVQKLLHGRTLTLYQSSHIDTGRVDGESEFHYELIAAALLAVDWARPPAF